MTELEKYELVNSTKNNLELQEVILKLADETGNIQGRSKSFSAAQMASDVDSIINGFPLNLLTRSYGIRQQMIYFLHYKKIIPNANIKAEGEKQESN